MILLGVGRAQMHSDWGTANSSQTTSHNYLPGRLLELLFFGLFVCFHLYCMAAPAPLLPAFISSFHICIYAQTFSSLPPSPPPSPLLNKASPSAAANPPPPSSTPYSLPSAPGMSARALALPLACFPRPLITLNADCGGLGRAHPSDRPPCPSPCFLPAGLLLCC